MSITSDFLFLDATNLALSTMLMMGY